jgi:hypothetical protein
MYLSSRKILCLSNPQVIFMDDKVLLGSHIAIGKGNPLAF